MSLVLYATAGKTSTIIHIEIDKNAFLSTTVAENNINQILSAQEDDMIFLNFNTGGGDWTILNVYINAIDATPAYVTGTIQENKYALSAGAILFCTLDQRIALPSARLLFHKPYIQPKDRTKDPIPVNDVFLDQYMSLLQDRCGDILTTSDLAKIRAGEEIILYGYEVHERIKGPR